MTDSPILTVDSLSVTFRSRSLFGQTQSVQALDDVSFDVQRGTTLGVVGQSGSGKSTLARALVGLQKADSGSIVLDDRHLEEGSRADRAFLRSRIQMIFQDSYTSLNPRKTIGSTLAEPLLVHRIVPRSGLAARVKELLSAVGLPSEYMQRYPWQLSGGQRQRVNIARALASEPELVVADEPTSALDVSIRAQILELMLALQRDLGLTYVFITHDLNVVRYVSDQVMVMKDGRVVEMADSETIHDNPQHEYTRALLEASPTIGAVLDRWSRA